MTRADIPIFLTILSAPQLQANAGSSLFRDSLANWRRIVSTFHERSSRARLIIPGDHRAARDSGDDVAGVSTLLKSRFPFLRCLLERAIVRAHHCV